jgi:protein SCO1/2
MKKVRLLLWALVPVVALGAFAAHQLGSAEGTTKGSLGRVPAFELSDQLGRKVRTQDLAGAPWVANFVFTRCPSVCPLLSAKFHALQKQLGDLPRVRFVSISVDPEYDTPSVLASYAARFEADPKRWLFLTGPLSEIERTVVQGFKVHRGDPEPSASDPNLIEIMHGEHFVLVDGQGDIRGYYRADTAGLKELEADLRELTQP